MSRSKPVSYTPELISELKEEMHELTRAGRVKHLERRLKICDRQARRAYAKYFESNVESAPPREADLIPVSQEAIEPRSIRRLYWDLEVSPNVALVWKAGWKLNVSHESIIKERAIIMVGFKWEGDKEAQILTWDENQDDKALLVAFLDVAAQADEMVAHNGDKFDMPWFRTRCLFHGLTPPPDYKTVDTLAWARRKFYFNSNKLDYIAQFLGLGAKLHTSYGLWKDILLNRCPKAMAEMTKYCRMDVILLEKVWRRLSELVAPKTHAGVLAGGERWHDPYDGSTTVYLSKTKVTAGGTKQYQMRNRATGKYFTIGATAFKAYQEAKGL